MKKRSYQEVRDWLFACLHKASGKKVAYHHKVSTHIGKGVVALHAYLNVLNECPNFAADGLTLVPGNVPPDPNVEELLAAILDDYLSRGWEIYYA
jgi:hypothetical protein